MLLPRWFLGRVYGGGTAAPWRAETPWCRALLVCWAFSLSLSARSFTSITCSQKVLTAVYSWSPLSIASMSVSGANLSPISSRKTRRGTSHAGQASSVCCAVSSSSPQWWQMDVTSRRIFSRHSPNTPWPVSTWVVLNVSGTPPLSLHLSQLGRTARTARLGRTASSSNSCECHRSHASSLASSRTSTVGAVGVARRSKVAALRCSYTRRRARACSSNGGTRPARSLSRRTPSCITSLPGWRSSCGAFSPESGYAGLPPDLRPIQVLRKGLVTGSLLRRAYGLPILPRRC